MPVRGRGAFPLPDATFVNDTSNSSIAEYRALKTLPKSDHALRILRSVGEAVRPIMVKHGWKLPLLAEMYPKSNNLLGINVNKGQKIALRLRRPFDRSDFLDEQSIIETMLHELTHNIRGPHDEVFFQHLETLTEEWYELRSSGRLTGQGFFTPGLVLGGRAANPYGNRTVPSTAAKRLGGSSSTLPAREAAAEAAARRMAIAAACPSNDSTASLQASQEQEEEERVHGIEVIVVDDDDDFEITRSRYPVIDVDGDEDDDVVLVEARTSVVPRVAAQPGHFVRQTQNAAALRASLLDGDSLPALDSHATSADIDSPSRSWTCQTCTLCNDLDALRCSACEAVRPGVDNWICRSCGHVMLGTFADFWCCSRCGQMKIA